MRPLPRLVLIADRFTEPARRRAVMAAVRAGVSGIQLRDHAAPPKQYVSAATALLADIKEVNPNAWVVVNSRPSVAKALATDLHLRKNGHDVAEGRQVLGPTAQIGFSAHDIREAEMLGVDYLFYSPVYETPSKPGKVAVGVLALKSFCEKADPVPVYALGGITPQRVPACRRAGAWGVAVLSYILDADDPGEAARAFLKALQ